MMDQHEDPRFEQWLKGAARSYHSPLPTPREEMWKQIAERRRSRHVIPLHPWMGWVAAAAAVLIVGIGIGRWTAHQTSIAAGDTAQGGSDVVYQIAATQYLSRTEAFLTSFRADLEAHHAAGNGRLVSQARDLLTTTRLMLDSPAAKDAQLRSLLDDLELVLVQISQLDPARDGRDADLITQGMNQSNVLPKLRSAIPAGPVPVRTQGAL